MSIDTTGALHFVRQGLSEVADPERAEGMAAYMKHRSPFYGVQKPGRMPILRALIAEYPPETPDDYVSLIQRLWNEPEREPKYIALGWGRKFAQFHTPRQLSFFRQLVVEGAWWDLVDDVAVHLVGGVLKNDQDKAWEVLDPWLTDDDMWLRRTYIICQLPLKAATDVERLRTACTECAHEKEFFIRKAIGWALREYAKTDPEFVRSYVDGMGDRLSGLSIREATKHLT